MRRLYLMRHGKAQAGLPPGGDRDRALVEKGRRTSRRVGAFCRDRERPPTFTLCSPARRAIETCDAFCAGFGSDLPRQVADGLYPGDPEALLRAIAEIGDARDSALLVGHNPGLQSLALALGRLEPGPALARLRARFPPAALAVFETGAGGWAAFASGARLVAYATAKELG